MKIAEVTLRKALRRVRRDRRWKRQFRVVPEWKKAAIAWDGDFFAAYLRATAWKRHLAATGGQEQ